VIDKYHSALFTPKEAARYLRMPTSTMRNWMHRAEPGETLVLGLVEAHVLRARRDLDLSTGKIREAAAAVRREFDTPYGLATRKIATDGVDVFIHYADTPTAS
jgi:hypothetical protein